MMLISFILNLIAGKAKSPHISKPISNIAVTHLKILCFIMVQGLSPDFQL